MFILWGLFTYKFLLVPKIPLKSGTSQRRSVSLRENMQQYVRKYLLSHYSFGRLWNTQRKSFFCRYIGSNINIQTDLFRYYELSFYFYIKDQQTVLDALRPMQEGIEAERRIIENVKNSRNTAWKRCL